MKATTVERTINAPVEQVFRAVSDVREFAKAQPQILDITFLSQQQAGVGTRFRETRLMKGRKAAMDLEITELVENQRVRLVADSHGTAWDTVFSVAPASPGGTRLSMRMEARAHGLLARVLTPLMRGMVARAVAKDMDRVKAHCEVG